MAVAKLLSHCEGIQHPAAESVSIMETRKLQLHYPLDRLTEPVITRLVTDFDLLPNLIRADVDSAKGGWIIVDVTGDSSKIDTAVDYLLKQGLLVAGPTTD